MAAKLRKGDTVIVLAGKSIGMTGEIARVLPKEGKAVVKGVNTAIRHRRQTADETGGRRDKDMPVDLSNLALLDTNGKPTRVGFRLENGKKVRFAKTTGDAV